MLTDPALLIDGLTLSLGGRTILDSLTLRAERGAITALLGSNGAGKTTTVRICTGLLAPDSGTVRVLGEAPGSVGVLPRVGLMPQSTGAWSGVRAAELLTYLASLYANPLAVPELMEALRISDAGRTPYRRLSGGQQQAVNLAGCLIGRPELVYLDEPTAGMDPHLRRNTWELLRTLRDAGVSVLLTTHGMDEAAALADHVWIMDAGRVVVDGTVADLTGDGSLEDAFLRHTSGDRP